LKQKDEVSIQSIVSLFIFERRTHFHWLFSVRKPRNGMS
jgi:hypothetical protein